MKAFLKAVTTNTFDAFSDEWKPFISSEMSLYNIEQVPFGTMSKCCSRWRPKRAS